MKNILTSFLSLSLLCLLGAGALADHHRDLKEHIQISEKIWVNGTKVKPGRYLVRYNTANGEMQLEMNGKVVAQAKATVIVNNDKFDQDALLTRTTSDGMQLTGIRLGGQHEELQLTDISASSDQDGDFNLDMGW